jgi:hypothetical protein
MAMTNEPSAMRTHVEFRSAKFPSEDEDGEMNPGRWGARLAEYLIENLPRFGVKPVGSLLEDWGYRIPLVAEHFRISICCGNYPEYPDGFLCFLDPSTPTVRRLFRTIDTRADLATVAKALDALLHSDPDIYGIRWWSAEESAVPGR